MRSSARSALPGPDVDGTGPGRLERQTVDLVSGATPTARRGRIVADRPAPAGEHGSPEAALDRLRFLPEDDAYVRIRARMMDRVYPPGDVVVPEDLAWELGIESSAVRYALTRLAVEGYVRRDVELGYVVSQLDVRAVEEVFDARLAIELGVIELSIHKTSSLDLAALSDRFQTMADLVVDDRVTEAGAYLQASVDFHEQLVALAGSDVLTGVFRELCARTLMTRAFGCAPDSARQLLAAQRDLLEAFKRADIVAARAAAYQHCAAAKHRMRGILRHTGGRL